MCNDRAGSGNTAHGRPGVIGSFVASQASFAQTVSAPLTWHSIANMSTPRVGAAAATGKDGRIYVFGGQDQNYNFLASAEVYDPTTNTWSAIAPMPTARTSPGAATGPDGRIYVIGGQTATQVLSTVEIYDPATDTWSTGPSAPSGIFSSRALTGPDGLIYVFQTNYIFVLDPATQTWSTRTPGNVTDGAVTLGHDGRFYIVGGGDSNGFPVTTLRIYDPSTDTWTSGPSMPTARFDLVAATAADGRIYAIGGDSDSQSVATVEVYDPSTNSWSSAAPMSVARYLAATAVGADGSIYVLGGVYATFALDQPLSSAEVLS